MDEKTRKKRQKVSDDIKTSEKKGEEITKNWEGHMMARHEIESFTTIVGDKLFQINAREGQVLLPFMEYHGDHSMNWIIILDKKTNEEVARKNIRTVDMINWKLFSSQLKINKNDRKNNR